MQVARTSDPDAGLRAILDGVLAAVGTNKGLLSLLNPVTYDLRVGASQGFDAAFLEQVVRVPPGGGACGTCLLEKNRVVVTDVEADPIFKGYVAAARMGGFRACHSTPLITQANELVGVLTVHFDAVHEPDGRERRLMDLFARLGADFITRTGAEGHLSRAAQFPDQNPNPVMRIAADGRVLYANRSSGELLDLWQCSLGGLVPHDLRAWVAEALAGKHPVQRDQTWGRRTYACTAAPFPEFGYVNLYTSDVTIHQQTQRALEENARLLRTLAEEHKQAEQALREKRGVLRLAMRGGRMGAWSRNLATNRVWWSRELEELFGLRSGGFQGTEKDFFEYVHPEDRPAVGEAVRVAIERHEDYSVEFRFRHGTGEWRNMEGRGRAVYDADGQATMLYGIGMDVTERCRAQQALRESREALFDAQEKLKQYAADLEKTVAERTARLQEIIGELEAFSYSISHDMRAPLRAMQSFSRILVDEYQDKLDDTAKDYLHRIENGANRLDLLVRDVLAYSRVSKADHVLTRIDLQKLVRETLASYQEFQEPKASVKVHSLPEVLGHEALLFQVISNLLGNAVKFVRPGVKPTVNIRSERVDGKVRVWVEDNGIGIDPKHHQQIFEIFGRVHSEKEFTGTGIGLAVVRRAVHRMGGEVGVESKAGEGSRFWFALPTCVDEN